MMFKYGVHIPCRNGYYCGDVSLCKKLFSGVNFFDSNHITPWSISFEKKEVIAILYGIVLSRIPPWNRITDTWVFETIYFIKFLGHIFHVSDCNTQYPGFVNYPISGSMGRIVVLRSSQYTSCP